MIMNQVDWTLLDLVIVGNLLWVFFFLLWCLWWVSCLYLNVVVNFLLLLISLIDEFCSKQIDEFYRKLHVKGKLQKII